MSFGTNLGLDSNPYASQRMPILARRGMVATEEPLAAQAGLRILQRGGNAADAAVATAITLAVTAPAANGIGSDAFALIWDGRRLHGLNGSGRACAAHDAAYFAGLGLEHVPMFGWNSVTVPGAPAAWRDLHSRFGRLPFESLFESAIEYATNGFPVAPLTAARWATSASGFARLPPLRELQPWRETFCPNGRVPAAGEVWSSGDMARTLRRLAETGAEAFYRGDLADRIADFAAACGAVLTRADLAAHSSTWVEPICAKYRGHEIWEIPPNGNGIVALAALSILDGLDLKRYPRESAESYHLQIEAIKLAFADGQRFIGDPEFATIPRLLDPEYISQRRSLIGERAATPEAGNPPRGGTVYACTADVDGMMVSFIQSNYSGPVLGFGSGVVVPGTGISLHSRGGAFSLDPESANFIRPGKRPAHTIIPAFVTRDGKAIGPFGVMGGPMQPQGHVQMVVNQIDYGMNPQASIDAPRWQWLSDSFVDIETSVPNSVAESLESRGHQLSRSEPWAVATTGLRRTPAGKLAMYGDFGKAQIIVRRDDGTYVGGSEPRADGCAVGY